MNTFGSATLQLPLYDPASVDRSRFEREEVPDLAKANSFCCYSGRRACVGWVLLKESDYDKLDKYSTSLQLDVGKIVLKNLAIVQARCVTRGVGDPLYLVELTDARGVLSNKWFQALLNAEYNIRAPAYPETFYYNTLNVGATWTWTTLLENLWPALLGAWPGLPITPAGMPEGLRFQGVSLWTALNDVLDYLGLVITYGSSYSIKQLGAADSSFSALQTLYAQYLEDDLEYVDVGSGRVPKTVKVLFARRNRIFGTEESVYLENDDLAQQWDTKTVYAVEIQSPFTSAVGNHYIWANFTVRYDQNSDLLPEDTATATTIAQEIVNQYFAKIYHQTLGAMSQVYSGALPFVTGSQVDSVSYYMDSAKRYGWKTKIERDV